MAKKLFLIPSIETSYAEIDYISSIAILNTTKKEIKIIFISEGAYQNLFGIQSKRVQSFLHISDQIQLFTNNPNDELAAHKISATTMKISIHENISLFIKSKQATIIIEAKALLFISRSELWSS